MEGIRRFAAFLVEQAQGASPEVAFEPEARPKARGARKKAGTVKDLDIPCPLCGQGHVTENSKAFSCSRWREGCNMTVWKNCLESRGGPTLTPALMKLVVEKREVAGSTGVIRYEPGKLPSFEPNDKAVIPEKKPAAKKSGAKKSAGKKPAVSKKAAPAKPASAAPKKRATKKAPSAPPPEEAPIESLLDLLKE